MKRLSLFLPFLALFLTGCVVVSVFPYYLETDLVSAGVLEGKWVPSEAPPDAKESFTFKKWVTQGCWFESVGSDGKTDLAGSAHLFQLGSHRFLDLAVSESDGAEQAIRPHLLLQVKALGSRLEWRMLDSTWLEEQLRRSPDRLNHRYQLDQSGKTNGFLLTGSSGELRAFLLENADRTAAWGEWQVWRRDTR